MSHYTHNNLSPVTQVTVQQLWRTIAFMAGLWLTSPHTQTSHFHVWCSLSETLVFAYLGLAIFSYDHSAEPALIIWSIVLILIGRAVNIYPLSFIANYFREHKITKQMQLVMWFSGTGCNCFRCSTECSADAKLITVFLQVSAEQSRSLSASTSSSTKTRVTCS